MNDIKNFLIQWVLTPTIDFWRFGSPSRLQLPKWEFTWECEGSFLCTFLHSQASLLARTLASPCFGREPKAKVTTFLSASKEAPFLFFVFYYYSSSSPCELIFAQNKLAKFFSASKELRCFFLQPFIFFINLLLMPLSVQREVRLIIFWSFFNPHTFIIETNLWSFSWC